MLYTNNYINEKNLPSLITGFFILINLTSYSQILFYEDFDFIPGPGAGGAGTYVFPAGWLLRNVDNRTPDIQTTYVNEAWERREDFGLNVTDSCAFSTSFYSPVGPADDWMWTPLIGPLPPNCELTWLGRAYDLTYPDGYEVRIMTSTLGPPTGGTGVIGNQITNSTVVFSTLAEGTGGWVSHNVNLSAYTGQSVYVGFRNNSNNQFLLVIDDVKVEAIQNYDAGVISVDTLTEYTLIPKTQVSPLPLGGSIRNEGILNLTNVSMKVDIFDGSMTQIFTTTSTPAATLVPGATFHFNAGTWTPPTVADVYTVKFSPVMTETDEETTNDTITKKVIISDFTYARDSGAVVGTPGIGAGNGGFLGQEFQIFSTARLTSVQTYVTGGHTGRRYGALVWNMSGGIPNTIVAYTDTLLYPDDSADFYTMPIDGGEFMISPGTYAVTMIEFSSDSTIQIGLTSNVFVPNRTWVNWPTNPFGSWANNEDFGSSFARTYVIRPQFYPVCPPDIITGFSITNASCGLDNGIATVTTTGTGPFTYAWSSGGTSVTDTALAFGDHIVTVTDEFSTCFEIDTVTILNSLAPVIDSINFTNPLCFGSSNGTATGFISGGTPGYTYSWAPSGGTAITATGLLANTYTLTVTDTLNCQASLSATLTDPPVLIASADSTDESCLGCSNGTATASQSGGTPGYIYSWAPSGGTLSTATGLTPGTYTVTITDMNGCSTTATTTVNAFVPNSIEDQIGLYNTKVFPNPSTGLFTLTGTIDYKGSLKIEVINILGEIILNKVMTIDKQINTILEVNTGAGSYILKITAGTESFSKQLVIK